MDLFRASYNLIYPDILAMFAASLNELGRHRCNAGDGIDLLVPGSSKSAFCVISLSLINCSF